MLREEVLTEWNSLKNQITNYRQVFRSNSALQKFPNSRLIGTKGKSQIEQLQFRNSQAWIVDEHEKYKEWLDIRSEEVVKLTDQLAKIKELFTNQKTQELKEFLNQLC